MMSEKVLQVDDLKVYYPVRQGLMGRVLYVKAVDGVTLDVEKGEVLGIVGGESPAAGSPPWARPYASSSAPREAGSSSTDGTSPISRKRSCAPTANRSR